MSARDVTLTRRVRRRNPFFEKRDDLRNHFGVVPILPSFVGKSDFAGEGKRRAGPGEKASANKPIMDD